MLDRCVFVIASAFLFVGMDRASAEISRGRAPETMSNQSPWIAVSQQMRPKTIQPALTHASDDQLVITMPMPGVSLSDMKGGDGLEYTQLNLPGSGFSAQKYGWPAMPLKGTLVEIPYGVDFSVELVDESTVSLGTGYKINPHQIPSPDDGSPMPPFVIDENAYATDAFFPGNYLDVREPYMLRGRRVVFVGVYPLQYNPVTTELRSLISMDFRLVLTGDVDPKGELRKKSLATESSEILAKRNILSAEPWIEESTVKENASLVSNGAHYLIIAKNDLVDEVEPLAAWKQSKGWLTRVLSIDAIGNDPDDVLNFIQTAYDTWNPAPVFVLLVGDFQDVPSYPIIGHRSSDDPDYQWMSDHTYACLDGGDFLPDILIGRLTVSTETECTIVVDKILAYDRTPLVGDWYDDFLSAAYFQDRPNLEFPPTPPNGIADKWYMEISADVKNFLASKGMTTHTAWCPNNTRPVLHYRQKDYAGRPANVPDPIPLSVRTHWTDRAIAKTQIFDVVNNGVGWAIHRDHGGASGWSDPPFKVNDINNLVNGSRTPVVYSIDCYTGKFYHGSDCGSEAWLKHDNGGAVGVMASNEMSTSGFNEPLLNGIIEAHFPDYDTDGDDNFPSTWRPAEAMAYGKLNLLLLVGDDPDNVTRDHFFQYHWFGDPEMKLRTQNPVQLGLEYSVDIGGGGNVGLNVLADKGGLPMPGIDVAFAPPYPAKATIWRSTTNSAGEAQFEDIGFTALEVNTLVATEANGIPFETTLDLAEAGACCLDAIVPGCTDGVSLLDCINDIQGMGAQGRWTPGTCANLDIACGSGACCHDDGMCTEINEAGCTSSGDRWLGYGTTCDDCCVVNCPGGSTSEPELCGQNSNAGCDDALMQFDAIACGDSVCGTLWADALSHDTDWFELVIPDSQSVQLTFNGEVPATFSLQRPLDWGAAGCNNLAGWDAVAASGESCDALNTEAICLPAGTYYLRVGATVDSGHPCDPLGFGNDYTLSVECQPCALTTGACCDNRDGTCATGIAEVNCQEFGMRFIANGNCDDFDPPCGEPWGACCSDENFDCNENTFAIECPATGRFLPYPANCGSFEPTCLWTACCLPDDTCNTLLLDDCLMLEGQPQGSETACRGIKPCCFPDGSCEPMDEMCCAEAGGVAQSAGVPTVSAWGMTLMILLIMTAGTLTLPRRKMA